MLFRSIKKSKIINEELPEITKGKIEVKEDKEVHNTRQEKVKEKKAERNRRYAKESRDRKKKYVKTLEQQVDILKYELNMCKSRLKNYELFEKYINLTGYEFYDSLSKIYKEMHENNQPATNQEFFLKSLEKVFDQIYVDQINALNMLLKLSINIAIPLPGRLFMWLSQQKMNPRDAKDIIRVMGTIISPKHAKIMAEYENLKETNGKSRAYIDHVLKE